jgi:hypothetical protein
VVPEPGDGARYSSLFDTPFGTAESLGSTGSGGGGFTPLALARHLPSPTLSPAPPLPKKTGGLASLSKKKNQSKKTKGRNVKPSGVVEDSTTLYPPPSSAGLSAAAVNTATSAASLNSEAQHTINLMSSLERSLLIQQVAFESIMGCAFLQLATPPLVRNGGSGWVPTVSRGDNPDNDDDDDGNSNAVLDGDINNLLERQPQVPANAGDDSSADASTTGTQSDVSAHADNALKHANAAQKLLKKVPVLPFPSFSLLRYIFWLRAI